MVSRDPEHKCRADAGPCRAGGQIVPVAFPVGKEQLQHFDGSGERKGGKERVCRSRGPIEMEEYGEAEENAEMDDLIDMRRFLQRTGWYGQKK